MPIQLRRSSSLAIRLGIAVSGQMIRLGALNRDVLRMLCALYFTQGNIFFYIAYAEFRGPLFFLGNISLNQSNDIIRDLAQLDFCLICWYHKTTRLQGLITIVL